MNFTPLVSIIMTAYNAAGTIQETIESVFAQSYENWELILIDDGSKDHTSVIAQRFQGSRIHLFIEKNKSVSATRKQ